MSEKTTAEQLEEWRTWARFVFTELPGDADNKTVFRAVCEKWDALEQSAQLEGRRAALREIEGKLRPLYQGYVHRASWDNYTEGYQDAVGNALAEIELLLAPLTGDTEQKVPK